MAEGFGEFRPRPPRSEIEHARDIESGSERREDIDGVPCAAESLALEPGNMATLMYHRETSAGGAEVLEVIVSNSYEPDMGRAVQCPHNGVVNDFVEGKPFPKGDPRGGNCRRCLRAVLATTSPDRGLPPAPKA